MSQTSLGRIASLAASWGIADDWDVLVVGDGSGQGWNDPCGWSSVLVDRHARGRKLFYGAMNLGTSGLAELIPYVQAMAWYEAGHGARRRAKLDRPILHVAIVTDCKSIADQGNQILSGAKELASVRAHRPFWVALLDYERAGYAFSFRWVARAQSALNAYCDNVAGRSRIAVDAIKDVQLPVDERGRTISIYECNEDEERKARRRSG